MLAICERRVTASGLVCMKREELVEGWEVVHHPVTVVEALCLLALEQVVSFLELGRRHVELFN